MDQDDRKNAPCKQVHGDLGHYYTLMHHHYPIYFSQRQTHSWYLQTPGGTHIYQFGDRTFPHCSTLCILYHKMEDSTNQGYIL